MGDIARAPDAKQRGRKKRGEVEVIVVVVELRRILEIVAEEQGGTLGSSGVFFADEEVNRREK